jgi:FkbM family methyltransferase
MHRVLVWGYDPGLDSEKWWKRFGELHPGWEFTTWQDPIDPAEWELGRLFESCSSGAQLADLLRIEILWRHGGVYVDSDVEPLASMDPLMTMDFFIGTENGHAITNAVIGAAAGHPALRALMDRLLEYERLPDGRNPNETTGPLFYSRSFERRDDVMVLPREVFYPYHPQIGIARGSGWSQRHVICVHHWAASWRDPLISVETSRPSFLMRAKRVARRKIINHASPLLRRIAAHVIDSPAFIHGSYVGDNRVLISTTDGFRMHAVADDLSLTPELLASGWYDKPLLGFLERVLRPGDWFVDVGANVGLFSLAAAKRVGRWGRVICYEADPELAEICRSNAGMNWFRNVNVIATAAGSASGEITFSRHPRYRMLSVAGSVDHETRAVREDYETVVVPVERVDDRIPAGVPVRIVKIDVEGGESDVLSGMSSLLVNRMVDYIVMEVIRGNGVDRWFSLLDHLRNFVTNDGALLYLLDNEGGTRPTTVEEISIIESLSQVVIDFT